MIDDRKKDILLIAVVRIVAMIGEALIQRAALDHMPPSWHERFMIQLTELQGFIGWMEMNPHRLPGAKTVDHAQSGQY